MKQKFQIFLILFESKNFLSVNPALLKEIKRLHRSVIGWIHSV